MAKKIILTEEQFKNILGFNSDHIYKSLKPKNFFTNIFENEELDEGIFKTYDISFVVKHFCKYLNFAKDYSIFANHPEQYNGFIINVVGDNNMEYIEMVVHDNEETLKKVNDTLKLCGYYEAFFEEYCEGYVQIGYEKMHDDKIDLKTDKIYHVTSRDYKLKIARYGLVPKSHNKKTKHLERIYFFTKDYGKDGFLYIANELFGNKTTFGYIVYEVDVNKLNNVSFHDDVNTDGGIYTTDNIPPNALTIKYEFNKI